jgi:hypothetical protein
MSGNDDDEQQQPTSSTARERELEGKLVELQRIRQLLHGT